MELLNKKDFQVLHDFIREGYAIHDLDNFARWVISKLPKIVPAKIITHNEINPRRRRTNWVWHPADAVPSHNLRGAFERHIPEHPLVVGIAPNRSSKDFSERDRLLLNLLSPHLMQAYRNAELVTQMRQKLELVSQLIAVLDVGVIVLTKETRTKLMTRRACQWLTEYFGRRSVRRNSLPEELRRWIAHQKALLNDQAHVPLPLKPLVKEHEAKRLVIRLISDVDRSVLLLEEQQAILQPTAIENLGLTPRETEVLTWVAKGKSNAEIGTILGLSTRTIQKHLEHIYQKIGVESRTAAAAKAYEIASVTKS